MGTGRRRHREARPTCHGEPEMNTIVATLWPHLRRYRRLGLVAIAAMVGEVVTQLLSPWPLKFIFDSVLFRHNAGQLVVRSGLAGKNLRLLLLLSIAAL